MTVNVEFNSETYDEFFKGILKEYPELLGNLEQDFADYIESDRLSVPDYFGRDAPYMRPESAVNTGLMHIHIAIPPTIFPNNRAQYYRTCPKDAPQQDAALIYTQGLYEEDRYSLIALLHPSAHAQARDYQTMRYLIAVAERFRDKY